MDLILSRSFRRYVVDVIARFQARIDKAKPLMDEILATELEEHELNAALAQLAKVESLALHGKAGTTVAKPRRVNWFSEKRDLERAGKFPAVDSIRLVFSSNVIYIATSYFQQNDPRNNANGSVEAPHARALVHRSYLSQLVVVHIDIRVTMHH